MSGSPAARFASARQDPALVVLEGFHALKHALRFGARIELAVAHDLVRLEALAESLAPDVVPALRSLLHPVDLATLRSLAAQTHATGVLAIAHRPTVDLGRLLAPSPAPVVLLEAPAHPGNLGAVIRVAAAAGAAGVLTTGGQDPWGAASLRGSAGLHFALSVMRLDALPATARTLIALHPDGEPLRAAILPESSVLAFGTERNGLSTALLDRATLRLAIPMQRGVSSLNLATAVAVTLYATMRQDAR